MWPSENARQSFFPVASHECGVGVCFAFREHSHYDNSFALGVMHSSSDLVMVVVLGKVIELNLNKIGEFMGHVTLKWADKYMKCNEINVIRYFFTLKILALW